MSHFTDTGRKWPLGQIQISTSLQDIDAKAQKTINGVTGDNGTTGDLVHSTPAAPIIINGAGLSLLTEPKWPSGVSGTRKVSPFRFIYSTPSGNPGQPSTKWDGNLSTPSGVQAKGAAQELWIPLADELIDKATITRIRAYFVVAAGKGGLPSNYPAIYVCRRNEVTGASDAIPFVGSNIFPTQPNITAYANGGVPNVLEVVPTNAGGSAVVDLSTYSYTLIYVDDDFVSLNYNTVTGFELQFGSVLDMAQP